MNSLFAEGVVHDTPAEPVAYEYPPVGTPVLALSHGEWVILERRTETPGFEDAHVAFDFWCDPTDTCSEYEDQDATRWLPLPPVDNTAPTDTARLDWVLSFATGDDSALANARTRLLVNAIYVGLDGREAVDAAMVKEAQK